MQKEQFIRELLVAAQESGISEAEVYYYQAQSMRALAGKDEIEEYAVNTTGGLSLRGLVDGKMGISYTEALDKDAIVMLIRGVLESATLTSDQDEQFIFSGSPSYETIDASGNLGTPDERIDLALQLEKQGRSIDSRVRELGFTYVETEHETVRIVNTHGLDLQHTADTCAAYMETIAREGERVATGDAYVVVANLAEIDTGALAKDVVEKAVFQLDASPCESGEMPVILDNGAMTSLLGVFTGIFSADAAQKGLSLLAGKEGEMIAAPCVSIMDDPHRKGGLFSRGFDAEGVATQRKAVIENGRLNTLLHNLKTAKKAGVATTANAARAGYAGPVTVAPSNLYIAPGEKDLDALQAEMGNGLVICGVSGLHAGANVVSGDFSLLAYGYLVKDGKKDRAVEQVTVAGNLYRVLEDVVAVGSDLKPQTGRVFCPSVWVKSLSVAGK